MKQRHSPSRPAASAERPVLVVGASGQLGSRVVHQLVALRRPVRALVRRTSKIDHLRLTGVELVRGDLTDPATLDDACRGAGAVIATANAVAPLHGSTFEKVEDRGYAALIDACKRHACGRFVLVSVPVTPNDAAVPLFRYKRLIEQRLQASGHEHAVLRAAPFMDDWFALIGSRLPARGDPAALINRPWGFLQTFIGAVGNLIEQRGIALVPGPASTRHAFIAIDDVAHAMIRATDHPAALNATLDLAGPEALSWAEVAALYARVLGRPVQVVSTPGWVFRAQQMLMRPFSLAASNIMGLNWVMAQAMQPEQGHLQTPLLAPGAQTLGIQLKRAESFLREKSAQQPA